MNDIDKITAIKCFLCGDWVPIRKSRRDKPFFACRNCALTCFVNSDKGIMLLKGKTEKVDKNKVVV